MKQNRNGFEARSTRQVSPTESLLPEEEYPEAYQLARQVSTLGELAGLFKISSPEIMAYVAGAIRNPNIFKGKWKLMPMLKNYLGVRQVMLWKMDLPLPVLMEIVQDPEPQMRVSLAATKNLPREVAVALLGSENRMVLLRLTENLYLDDDIRVQAGLILTGGDLR